MQGWVNYMNKHPNTVKNGLYHFQLGDDKEPFYGFGDWVPVEKSPTKPIGGAYQYYSNKLLAEIAGILGKKADQATYQKVADASAAKYNELYFDAATANYQGATQGANLLPLSFGITQPTQKVAVAKSISENVTIKGNHLSTGFLSTQMLLPVLSQNGYHEQAYTVATQKTYPGWGYMIANGATTMWELWNSDTEKPEGMNSRNHFAYGSVGEWYYNYLAGIQQDAGSQAYKKIKIAPKPVADLTWAEGQYMSSYGLIKCRWDRSGNKIKLQVEIPAGTSARIEIPTLGNAKATIKESGKIVKPKTIDAQVAVVEVGSGSYIWDLQ
jgi:alpha-L-rhamnosidase